MVSASDWWEGLTHYNTVIFPLQIFVMVVAVVLTAWIRFRPGKGADIAMKIFLSCSMLFNGILFFLVLGTKLAAPLKYIQGGLFITIGILFLLDLFTGWSEFTFPEKGIYRNLIYILLVFVLLYPVLGLMRGHGYTQLIYPGTLPCGSTAFALVILQASLPKVKKLLILLLLIWALPFAPFVQIPQFKVYEDAIMFLTGISALILLIKRGKKKERVAL